MEILKYNKNVLDADFSDCRDLREIIARLEIVAEKKGHVVTRIQVNGLDLCEEGEKRLSGTPRAELQDLLVHTESTTALVEKSIQTTVDHIRRIQSTTLSLAEALRLNPGANLHQQFSYVVSSCHLLTDALLAIKQHVTIDTAAELHFLATVRELIAAYESHDMMLVADVLEYELSNSLDQWLTALTKSN